MNLDNFAPDHRPSMADEQGSARINALMASIGARLRELEGGELDLSGLDRLSEEARELYEQLVVLRHKAREAKVKGDRAAATEAVSEPAPIRLDVATPINDPRQITLIDAIENEKRVKREKRAAAAAKPTIAEPVAVMKKTAPAGNLEHPPIKDLAKAIAISEKFWFIAELFDKDATAYEQVIKRINTAGGLAEAKTIVDIEVLKKAKKKPAEEVTAAFMDLIERRFK